MRVSFALKQDKSGSSRVLRNAGEVQQAINQAIGVAGTGQSQQTVHPYVGGSNAKFSAAFALYALDWYCGAYALHRRCERNKQADVRRLCRRFRKKEHKIRSPSPIL